MSPARSSDFENTDTLKWSFFLFLGGVSLHSYVINAIESKHKDLNTTQYLWS